MSGLPGGGVAFDRLLGRLRLKLNAEGLIDLDLWRIDSTSVRASRAAAGPRKKGMRRLSGCRFDVNQAQAV